MLPPPFDERPEFLLKLLDTNPVALLTMVWWLIPSKKDAGFLTTMGNRGIHPDLNLPATLNWKTEAIMGKTGDGPRGGNKSYIRGLLLFAYQHGFFDAVLIAQSIFKENGQEPYCLRPEDLAP
jgi:hypothetical protein